MHKAHERLPQMSIKVWHGCLSTLMQWLALRPVFDDENLLIRVGIKKCVMWTPVSRSGYARVHPSGSISVVLVSDHCVGAERQR